MMYVFKNCRAFIRTVPSLVYDEYRVEDLDTNGEDHVADETRYFCMARPVPARVPRENDPFAAAPQSVYLDIGKGDLVPRTQREKTEVLSETV